LFDEIEKNLKDFYEDLTDEKIPAVRNVSELRIAWMPFSLGVLAYASQPAVISVPWVTSPPSSPNARYDGVVTDYCENPTFFCDAMLGGLARWLRAAGYDARFEYGIDDGDLVNRCEGDGLILLSCDGPMFERNVIKSGQVRALRLPRGLSNTEALRFVHDELGLSVGKPRCMACGGRLDEVPKHTVASEAPPLAYRNCEQFWRCQRCGRLLWQGTHWQNISRRLRELNSP